jgi:CRISPR-associated protein (TIGR03984 family)
LAQRELRNCTLFSGSFRGQTLPQALDAFFAIDKVANEKDTWAILYSPGRCFLARLAMGQRIIGAAKEEEPSELSPGDLTAIFEARVFNNLLEMRWLNDPNGNHTTAVISETQPTFAGIQLQDDPKVIGAIDPWHQYLLWGQSTGRTTDDGTQFATARIGAYYIPIPKVPKETYARFKAVEYLKTYEDGNVAVFDERLIGIEAC